MPTSVPMPTKIAGDVFALAMWNNNLRDNLNKLLNTGHRVLTVAQFGALGSPEGTKGTVAPDEVYLEVDSANGIQWHLAYESGEPTYKWRFLGGPPMTSEVLTVEGTASTTYAALATAGPSVPLPRAGDYDVTLQAYVNGPTSATTKMSYDIGGTGAVDADSLKLDISAAGVNASLERARRKAALTAVTLTTKYKTSAGTVNVGDRSISVTPTRLI